MAEGKKFKIETNNHEQGWLDAFNGQIKTNFEFEKVYSENEIRPKDADWFNHIVANGEAVWFEEVKG